MQNQPSVEVRNAVAADLETITAIYAHHVLHGTGSFEVDPPDVAEMQRRVALVHERGLPWLVAERSGVVAGFAYANLYHARAAFRCTLEDSVYIDPEQRGRGIGTLLLARLLQDCEARGARQMLAVIGDSANQGSIALHARHGFAHAGVLRAVGWKFGRWIDVVLMQRELGAGAGSAPAQS
jgi:phosphinothricin acetyltransferase